MPLPVSTVTVLEPAISSASSSISRCVAALAFGTTDAILAGSPETTAILGGGVREGIGDLRGSSGRATAAAAAAEVEVEVGVDVDVDANRCC